MIINIIMLINVNHVTFIIFNIFLEFVKES